MLFTLGDIHGNFANVKYQIKTKQLSDCGIIQVGDFGIGYTHRENDEKILADLNSFLKERNIIMYAIRGNHDDPFYFTGYHVYDNLKLLPDYTQLEIDGHNILFIGGAVSIDRKINLNRMMEASKYGSTRKSYWYDEVFVLDEKKLKNIKNVDMVITHTAPEWCSPDNRNGFGDFVLSYAHRDDKLLEDLTNERVLVTKMFNILKDNGNKIQKHYYGHYHRSDITLNGMTTHYLLGINEMMMVDELVQTDFEDLFK